MEVSSRGSQSLNGIAEGDVQQAGSLGSYLNEGHDCGSWDEYHETAAYPISSPPATNGATSTWGSDSPPAKEQWLLSPLPPHWWGRGRHTQLQQQLGSLTPLAAVGLPPGYFLMQEDQLPPPLTVWVDGRPDNLAYFLSQVWN